MTPVKVITLQIVALSLHKASIPEVIIGCSPGRMIQSITLLSLQKASIPEVHISYFPGRMIQSMTLLSLHKASIPEVIISCSPGGMIQSIALLSLHKASIPEVIIGYSPARMIQSITLLSLHKASIPEVHICCSPARMLQIIALSVKTPEPEKKIKKSPRMANVFIICKSQWRIRPYRREEVKDKNKNVQRCAGTKRGWQCTLSFYSCALFFKKRNEGDTASLRVVTRLALLLCSFL